MGQCYITRRGTKTGGAVQQLGIYPTGNDGRPMGNVTVLDNVTVLSKHLFTENSNILSVALPQNLRDLDDYCFQNCISLQNITIPDKVTNISQYCFNGCTSLSKVVLSKNLTNINKYAFQNCTGLYDLVISNDAEITTIGEGAFNNSNISNITLPNKLQTIGNKAFQNCIKLSSINIPSDCTSIGEYAFQSCTSLANIVIDENAKYTLGSYAFANCPVLTNESVHNLMEHYSYINSYVFKECTGLTNVEVSRFWTGMFYGCTSLITARSLKAANTSNSVFYNCTKLQEVYIADGTKTIGTNVFYGCTSLKTVYLPSSITTATNNSLTSTSSSYYIFYNCKALEDVQLGQDWNMSLRLNVSNNLTVDSMVAMFNSLKDLTGETTKTLTLGSTNLAKLSDEQKEIATSKNWTLA